jgi:N-acetylneuraminic acid mutarotase
LPNAFEDLPTGWTTLPEPPEVRNAAATVWTGEQVLVWGGYEFTGHGDEVVRPGGFVFDAATRDWERMSDSPLSPRVHPASAWSGRELLIWGGTDIRGEHFLADGAAYDPATGAWRRLPDAPIEARAPLAAWTGDELLMWGTAVRVDPRPRDGAAYNPATNDWRTIAEAPIELTDATAVWTGREMIVFGAALHGGNFPETRTAIAAAYDPETDSWRRLPDSTLSPQASTAAWVGQELVAWDYASGTATYDPQADEWRALPDVPLASGECNPESIAVGDWLLGDYCGLLAWYDPTRRRWSDLAGTEFVGWGFELVAADPVALLLGRNDDTGERRMLAYRPG